MFILLLTSKWVFFTIFITMNKMDIIFNDEDYYDGLLGDIGDWCKWQSIPTSKVILGVDENNVDGVDYFVITVNESLFSYLMWREFDMTEKYGREGWNGWVESNYNCETA
jgi:hypothetical protein